MNKHVLALIWDNASWHISPKVSAWIREYNRQVKRSSQEVRILACRLPIRSPWLNPIEPQWAHGKRRVVEPNGVLPADELADVLAWLLGICTFRERPLPQNGLLTLDGE